MMMKTSMAAVMVTLLSCHSAVASDLSSHRVIGSNRLQQRDQLTFGRDVRFAQGAPSPSQPNTSNPPAGAAEIDSIHKFAEAFPEEEVTGQIKGFNGKVLEIVDTKKEVRRFSLLT